MRDWKDSSIFYLETAIGNEKLCFNKVFFKNRLWAEFDPWSIYSLPTTALDFSVMPISVFG